MKTKEDILYNHLDYRWANDNLNVDDLLNAMEEYAHHQIKLLNLDSVSKRSELLIAFSTWLTEGGTPDEISLLLDSVDEFLKSN